MELIDYLKWRWKLFTGLLLVGLVLIGGLGVNVGSGSGAYEAKTQLLIRPPAGQSSTYGGSNLDRYINGEMAQLYSKDSLDTFVEGTDVSPRELARTLSWDHPSNTDLVSLSVVNADAKTAVSLVNGVADRYLASSKERALGPLTERSKQLVLQSAAARRDLEKASRTIAEAAAAYVAANPDRGLPSSSTLAPQASSDLSLAQDRLQRLDQERADLDGATAGQTDSRVLRAAVGATAPKGWGVAEYLGACVGLALVILTLAGIGLAMSKRVFGVARWEQATRPMALAHAVRYPSRGAAEQERSAQRVVTTLRTVGDPDRETAVVCLPQATPAFEQRTAALLEQVADAGWKLTKPSDLGSAMTHHLDGEHARWHYGQALLLVDLTTCELDDALLMVDVPDPLQRRIVPVLI